MKRLNEIKIPNYEDVRDYIFERIGKSRNFKVFCLDGRVVKLYKDGGHIITDNEVPYEPSRLKDVYNSDEFRILCSYREDEVV